MFKDLQKGYSVSILDKSAGTIKLKNGIVVSAGAPRYENKPQVPQIGIAPQYGADRVIDLTIECDGQTQTYVVPETGSIASGVSITLACDNTLVSNEVQSILKRSEDALSAVETHKRNIEECRKILEQLNPTFADSAKQNKRLDCLETAMNELHSDMRKLLEKLSSPSPKTSK